MSGHLKIHLSSLPLATLVSCFPGCGSRLLPPWRCLVMSLLWQKIFYFVLPHSWHSNSGLFSFLLCLCLAVWPELILLSFNRILLALGCLVNRYPRWELVRNWWFQAWSSGWLSVSRFERRFQFLSGEWLSLMFLVEATNGKFGLASCILILGECFAQFSFLTFARCKMMSAFPKLLSCSSSVDVAFSPLFPFVRLKTTWTWANFCGFCPDVGAFPLLLVHCQFHILMLSSDH